MGKICSSEEGRFRRADGAFGYLQYSFFAGLLQKTFHANGSEKAKSVTFWCCTDDKSPAATNYCETRKRPIQNEGSEQPEMADSADKRPRRSRAVQKLEVNTYIHT